ncbi:MmyB family transcriptional regulator [Phytomonospora endophytica]|uniref:Transcriptional regulator with XRE-family HTH domain n=1 Tax=Phytomonospora endophytica TaxID=714109 RepID=A0A841FTQ8_9ACTN|nr:helix-turn-helix domain-containing protein [Phytomonospora endophytica]MBB6038173.1 transcriptional regulator with XRE-family HTH domain [Phytomonospora endophytica]GIG67365.1 putative DNA-binding protein [Phytomonospora endophytica]
MNEVRRTALADYLRVRRAALRPEEVGLAPGRRRRTPGLRREEVALLSNVGVTWYTWLEQGRDINPSPEILAALARALRLDDAGAEYLYRLAGCAPPSAEPPRRTVPETLTRLMHAQSPAPALIVDAAWDLHGWNTAAEALYRYTDFAPADRNAAWVFFASPRIRAETVTWERHARRIVGELREGFARDVDGRVEALLLRLRNGFPEAAGWLDEHEVTHRGAGITAVVEHPAAGELHLDQIVLRSAEAPGLDLVVKLPVPGTGTAGRLRGLVAAQEAVA